MAYRWCFFPERLRQQESIARSQAVSSITARLLVNRGFDTPEAAAAFLKPTLGALSDPFAMSQMERAVERIRGALAAREPILIYGDSDVDGVSGTALLAAFLGRAGGRVATYIPNRLTEGYSLTDAGLAAIEQSGARVVITVDNGTAAVDPIARLGSRGVDVIVADHHEPTPELPVPLALLNPKWAGSGYPFPYLCGTGVAFQLASALACRIKARADAGTATAEVLHHCVALAALATVCDMVPLVGENRALARSGLKALETTSHPGLKALKRSAGIGREMVAEDISFRLGPRINAAGRLGLAGRALELLLCQDAGRAQELAAELEQRNTERQEIEGRIHAAARARVLAGGAPAAPVLVLADRAGGPDGWHAGVLGIVAARLVGEFHRPAVLAAFDGERGRGSARSLPGFDLHEALSAVAEHLVTFGGHPGAAGFELRAERFDAFRRALLRFATSRVEVGTEQPLMIDAELPLGVLTPSLMAEINRLSPFGQGLDKPLFAAPGLRLAAAPKVVGRSRSHLSFTVQQDGVQRKAIAFGQGHLAAELERTDGFDLAFTPRLNLFHGQAMVDLEVRDIRHGGRADNAPRGP